MLDHGFYVRRACLQVGSEVSPPAECARILGHTSKTFGRTDLENDGPFGFSFDRRGNLLTTLFVGAPAGSSVGSFRINADNSLTAITRNLLNGQIDSCWIGNNGRFAYSANYGAGAISSYRIGRDGKIPGGQ